MDKEHYVTRNTGELPPGSRIAHVRAKPWAVIRVAADGQMTLVSRHASQETATGITRRRNKKLSIKPKPSDDEQRGLLPWAVDMARSESGQPVDRPLPRSTPTRGTKLSSDFGQLSEDAKAMLTVMRNVKLPATPEKRRTAEETAALMIEAMEREGVAAAIFRESLLIRIAARKSRWGSTFEEAVAEALKDKGWDVAYMDQWDLYVFNAAQARLSTCTLI